MLNMSGRTRRSFKRPDLKITDSLDRNNSNGVHDMLIFLFNTCNTRSPSVRLKRFKRKDRTVALNTHAAIEWKIIILLLDDYQSKTAVPHRTIVIFCNNTDRNSVRRDTRL